MTVTERHEAIVERAKLKGRVLVEELVAHFGVTPQTIRKDLTDICATGKLTRIHGVPVTRTRHRKRPQH